MGTENKNKLPSGTTFAGSFCLTKMSQNISSQAMWGMVTQWSYHRTDDREILGSNSTGVASEFGTFVYPTLPVSFGRD